VAPTMPKAVVVATTTTGQAASMAKAFITIVNISLTSAFVIAAVCVARFLLKPAPKRISLVLWVVVGLRLMVPLSIESSFSFIPVKTETFSLETAGQHEANYYDSAITEGGVDFEQTPDLIESPDVNEAVPKTAAPYTDQPHRDPVQMGIAAASVIWLAGVMALLAHGIRSYIALWLKVKPALPLENRATDCPQEDQIHELEGIQTPFVFGVFRPRVFLPKGMLESERRFVITHEQAHIRHHDQIVKLVGYLACCLHWFNPFVWLAFALMTADMEIAFGDDFYAADDVARGSVDVTGSAGGTGDATDSGDEYARSASGKTYGRADNLAAIEDMPDLVYVGSFDGVDGYMEAESLISAYCVLEANRDKHMSGYTVYDAYRNNGRTAIGVVFFGTSIEDLERGLATASEYYSLPTIVFEEALLSQSIRDQIINLYVRPNYPVNANGLTYGTISYGSRPDLIAVIATNGREGYIYASDMDASSGIARNPTHAAEIAEQQYQGSVSAFSDYCASVTKSAADYQTIYDGLEAVRFEIYLNHSWESLSADQQEAVMALFPEACRTPANARAAYDAARSANSTVINVYESDGETVVGVMVIG